MDQSDVRMGWFGSVLQIPEIHPVQPNSKTIVKNGKVQHLVLKDGRYKAADERGKYDLIPKKILPPPPSIILPAAPDPVPVQLQEKVEEKREVSSKFGPWVEVRPEKCASANRKCPIPHLLPFEYQIQRRGWTRKEAEKFLCAIPAANRFWGLYSDSKKDIIAYRVLKVLPSRPSPRRKKYLIEGPWIKHDQSSKCPIPDVLLDEYILQHEGETDSDRKVNEPCPLPPQKCDWTKVIAYRHIVNEPGPLPPGKRDWLELFPRESEAV